MKTGRKICTLSRRLCRSSTFNCSDSSRTKYARILETNDATKLTGDSNARMVQLMPGLLYVAVITALFTVLLVTFTAVALLSQARAIVRQRYVGSVFSKKNVQKVANLPPILATMTAMLLTLRDVETDRLLTTFKRPAAMRLYKKCFYVRPYLSSGAYLVRLSDIETVSIAHDTLQVAFTQADRTILLQCRGHNLSKWRDSLNRLISNHK